MIAEVEALASVVFPVTVRVEIVVVARVEVPVTFNVPLDVRDDVAVIDPAVNDPNVPVEALRRVAKKFVLVAFPRVAVDELRLVIVPVAAVNEAIVVVARVVVPVTVRVPFTIWFPANVVVPMVAFVA